LKISQEKFQNFSFKNILYKLSEGRFTRFQRAPGLTPKEKEAFLLEENYSWVLGFLDSKL